MRWWNKRMLSWVAIGAIAIHTMLAGLTPALSAGNSPVFDPLAVTCLHQEAAGDSSPALPDAAPQHACDHCMLCAAGALAAPLVTASAILSPVSLEWTPALIEPATTASITSRPGLPRAPPIV